MRRRMLWTGCGLALAAWATAPPARAADPLEVRPLALQLPAGSRFPRLAEDPRGGAWLLYLVTSREAPSRLELRRFQDGGLDAARVVAEGGDWFVNWADFPALAADAAGNLAVCWLQKLGAGTFAYGVRLATSRDEGRSWGAPSWLHDDRTEAEHGFPSLLARGDGWFRAVWLDGRDMEATSHMTLRTRRFHADGTRGAEALLDRRVCECCATGVAATADGWLAVYRDRTEAEVRDIQVRSERPDGAVREGRVAADDWIIPG